MHAPSVRTSESVSDPEFQDNGNRLVHSVQPNNASFLHFRLMLPNAPTKCLVSSASTFQKFQQQVKDIQKLNSTESEAKKKN